MTKSFVKTLNKSENISGELDLYYKDANQTSLMKSEVEQQHKDYMKGKVSIPEYFKNAESYSFVKKIYPMKGLAFGVCIDDSDDGLYINVFCRQFLEDLELLNLFQTGHKMKILEVTPGTVYASFHNNQITLNVVTELEPVSGLITVKYLMGDQIPLSLHTSIMQMIEQHEKNKEKIMSSVNINQAQSLIYKKL